MAKHGRGQGRRDAPPRRQRARFDAGATTRPLAGKDLLELPPTPLLVATTNAGKLREFCALLNPLAIEVWSPQEHATRAGEPLPEVAETAPDFVGNALLKAASACRHSGLDALADDSGLLVDARDGAPGVLSARFAGADAANVALLLERLSGVDEPHRGAAFQCALVLCGPLAEGPGCRRTEDGLPWRAFVGSVRGRILSAPQGEGGFGYDPVFFHDDLEMTFAEAAPAAKSAVSHRGLAVAELLTTTLAMQEARARGVPPLFIRRLGLDAVAAALHICLSRNLRYADRALENALGERPSLGAKERSAVADVTWHALRNLGRLALAARALLGGPAPVRDLDPRQLPPHSAGLLAVLALADLDPQGRPLSHRGGATASALDALAGRDGKMDQQIPHGRKRLAKALRAATARLDHDDDLAAKALAAGHQTDFVRACRAQLGDAHATTALAYLDARGPLTLRLNPDRGDLPTVTRELERLGVRSAPAPRLDHGIICMRNARVTALSSYSAGGFEIQDAGSQAVAQAVAARPGETIADWCAGAGGKTLALAAAMAGKGRLVALDVHHRRLKECSRRLARAGHRWVEVRRLGDAADDNGLPLFDAVLVDAPCTSSGALRRTPELRWHLDRAWLNRLPEQQFAILKRAAGRVRVGGRLIYATCSILRAENETVVADFLASQPGWRLVEEQRIGPANGAWLERGPLPAVSPDGFYHATLLRTGELPAGSAGSAPPAAVHG